MNFFTDIIVAYHLQIIVILSALMLAFLLFILLKLFLKRWFKHIKYILLKEKRIPVRILFKPFWFLFTGLCLLAAQPLIDFNANTANIISHIFIIWIIIAVTWLSSRIISFIKIIILNRYRIETKDNLKARRINTRLGVIQRILTVIIIILGLSAILITFQKVRQIGVSILASAGVMGIIIGFAAQRSLSNLIAGIQIAITQPIRIDDVVVVEDEWGWIEEITLTYVVVRLWDKRRLVLPITYFIENAFQNWTRRTSDLLGSVFIYTDYSLPIEKVREELKNIVSLTPLWDGHVVKLQVTNMTEKTIEMRALVSAASSPELWDLRCFVREKLIDFLQKQYPDCLPRVRIEKTK